MIFAWRSSFASIEVRARETLREILEVVVAGKTSKFLYALTRPRAHEVFPPKTPFFHLNRTGA